MVKRIISPPIGVYILPLQPINPAGTPVPEEQGYPEEELTVPRLTFNTRNWRPDEDLRKLLRGIGGYGERLDEKHLDLWEIVEKPEAAERMERRRLVQMATLQT